MGDEEGITVTAASGDREVLSPEALEFVAWLHRLFEVRRQDLLTARAARQDRLDAGERPDFLAGDRRHPGAVVDGGARAEGPGRPPGRDHRARPTAR